MEHTLRHTESIFLPTEKERAKQAFQSHVKKKQTLKIGLNVHAIQVL